MSRRVTSNLTFFNENRQLNLDLTHSKNFDDRRGATVENLKNGKAFSSEGILNRLEKSQKNNTAVSVCQTVLLLCL